MTWNLNNTHAQEGDLAELVGLRHKHAIIRLQAGSDYQSHRGVLKHDDLIGKPWGSQVTSHNGSPFFLIQPSLGDLLRDIKRNTQILYPKDIGFILITMGIGPDQRVVEAGTGSGSLTAALAHAVGSQGQVFTYEAREEMHKLAQSNLRRLGLSERVTFNLRDIAEGFDETGADALFLDLPNPYDYLAQVRSALKPGGFFGAILPTTNQVSTLLGALHREKFSFVDVCEVLLRYYKSEKDRFRPADRMVAHTGYLVFARPVLAAEDEAAAELLEEIRQDEPPA